MWSDIYTFKRSIDVNIDANDFIVPHQVSAEKRNKQNQNEFRERENSERDMWK